MTALIYTLLFAGVLCMGTCLGFFLSCLLRFGERQPYKTLYETAVEENELLTHQLNDIKNTVAKYFGPFEEDTK